MKKGKFTSWKESNSLTSLAFNKTTKKKRTRAIILVFAFLAIIFSFVGFSVYGFTKMANYRNYEKIPLKIVIPKFSPEDFENLKVYDDDGSVMQQNLNNLLNNKGQELLNLNPALKLYLQFAGYDTNNLQFSIYDDKEFKHPLTIAETLYDGEKTGYLMVKDGDHAIKYIDHLNEIKVTVQGESLYFNNFLFFKSLAFPNPPNSAIDTRYISAYMPETFYKSNLKAEFRIHPSKDVDNLLWRSIKKNLRQNLLHNEHQETTDKNATEYKLQILPLITNEKLPLVIKSDNLVQLQDWFKNNSDYIYSKNFSTKEIDLSNGFYITYFPDAFNVDEFIKSSNPQEYFLNLKDKDKNNNSLWPIYEAIPDLEKKELTQFPHYYSSNTSFDNEYFKYSTLIKYEKKVEKYNGDLSEFKNNILEYIFKNLEKSISKSYPGYINPPEITGKSLLSKMFGINNKDDLKNYILFYNKYRNLNKESKHWSFDNINSSNINEIYSIQFNLKSTSDYGGWVWTGFMNFWKN